jgi:hypothetical protein
VLALCRDAVLGRRFVAAVTHLHWDPRWPDVKLCQVGWRQPCQGCQLQTHTCTWRHNRRSLPYVSSESEILLVAGLFDRGAAADWNCSDGRGL